MWHARGCRIHVFIAIVEQTSSSSYDKTKKVGGVNAVLEREAIQYE